MIALVLAAGYATRLYPLTEQFPKPLLKVREKPILDWLLEDLENREEISGYVVVTNHRFAPHFESWKERGHLEKPITILDDGSTDNENRLGAVMDIVLAVEKLDIREDLLVLAGDNVLDFSLNSFLAYFSEKKASCIMRHREDTLEKLQKTGVAQIDSEDRVLSMEEKPDVPKSCWAVPPFYLYRREDLGMLRRGIEAGCNTDAPGGLISWLCGQIPLYAMEMPGSRYDIGDLESYRQVQEGYLGISKGKEE